MTNEIIWIILGSVSTTMKDYFEVNYVSINWMGMIYCMFSPLVALSVYTLNKYGLKTVIVAGAFCNTIASGLKLFGYTRNGYIYQLIGSGFGGLGQSFLFFIPPTLAATWFGKTERTRASAIAMFMNTLGIALGFLLGSLLIPVSTDYDGVVKDGMFLAFLSLTVFSFLSLILSCIVVRNAPPTPPTKTQLISRVRRITKHGCQSKVEVGIQNISAQIGEGSNAMEEGVEKDTNKIHSSEIHGPSVVDDLEHNVIMQSTGLRKNWRYLMRMPSFHLLLHTYGIYFGLLLALYNLLNQMIITTFPSHENSIGIMGFSHIACGILGTLFCSIIIDKTHHYKIVSIAIFSSCGLSFLVFTLIIKYSGHFILTFVCFCIHGICASPFLTVGLEYLTEIVYPVKESNISAIILLITTLYSFALTYLLGVISQQVGSDVVGYTITGLYIAGLLCITLVRGELKRIGIDNWTQIGDRSEAKATSTPIRETIET